MYYSLLKRVKEVEVGNLDFWVKTTFHFIKFNVLKSYVVPSVLLTDDGSHDNDLNFDAFYP